MLMPTESLRAKVGVVDQLVAVASLFVLELRATMVDQTIIPAQFRPLLAKGLPRSYTPLNPAAFLLRATVLRPNHTALVQVSCLPATSLAAQDSCVGTRSPNAIDLGLTWNGQLRVRMPS